MYIYGCIHIYIYRAARRDGPFDQSGVHTVEIGDILGASQTTNNKKIYTHLYI